MPEQPSKPKRGIYLLSSAHANGQMFRIRCTLCRKDRYYFPDDLRQIFGDIDCDRVAGRMRCEQCSKQAYVDARCVTLTAREKSQLQARRLVAIKIRKVPVWEEVAL